MNSGGYLPRRISSGNIHRYSPPLWRIIVVAHIVLGYCVIFHQTTTLHAVPFFSLSNWETGVSKVDGPILHAAVPLGRSSLSITVVEKRKGLGAVYHITQQPVDLYLSTICCCTSTPSCSSWEDFTGSWIFWRASSASNCQSKPRHFQGISKKRASPLLRKRGERAIHGMWYLVSDVFFSCCKARRSRPPPLADVSSVSLSSFEEQTLGTSSIVVFSHGVQSLWSTFVSPHTPTQSTYRSRKSWLDTMYFEASLI